MLMLVNLWLNGSKRLYCENVIDQFGTTKPSIYFLDETSPKEPQIWPIWAIDMELGELYKPSVHKK